jgi:CelD/BcsL family acetyltransferase involved in cellulose biosynthesis
MRNERHGTWRESARPGRAATRHGVPHHRGDGAAAPGHTIGKRTVTTPRALPVGSRVSVPPGAALRVSLARVPDAAELGQRWKALEGRSDCSFFQSWTYTGCLVQERFPDAILLEAHEAGSRGDEPVALALFNRRRERFGAESLLLGESGNPSFDTVFIEHNGPLVARGSAPSVLPRLLRAAIGGRLGQWPAPAGRRVVLSGVTDEVLAAACSSGLVTALRDTRLAPAVDLAGLRRDGLGLLDRVSANTRYQLRRSDRRFAASGPLAIRRAGDAAEGHRWLEALAALHQRTWQSRGQPGAFADANFRRFHHALIDRGLKLGEVDLLEVSAGPRCLGYLLNFIFRGTVYAYQSGFDYALADRHEKPGLTAHEKAIEMYLREGLDRYDFLGGAERYKTSLAGAESRLHWAVLAARWSPPGIMFRLRHGYDALASMRREAGRGR